MKNNKQLQIFKNDLFKVAIKLENGQTVFDAETVAKSLGFTKTESKNEKKYTSIRWERVNEYLGSFRPQLGEVKKGDFIPESAVYKLAFKASNEVAEKFQDWLAIEVLPSIRINGGYISDNTTLKQVEKLVNKWDKKSKYLTEAVHDRKSVRKFIRDFDKMKIDECINTIVEIVTPTKGEIKHDLIDVAVKELKALDKSLIKDTAKHTYIKDVATEGIIILQDIKIGKQKKRIAVLEQEN